MTDRSHIRADDELREEIAALLPPDLELPSLTKLEYWRHWEYIPCTRNGRGPGSSLSYPPGTAQQVVALMGALHETHNLGKSALRLFLSSESYWVGAKALRPAVAAELERVRVGIEKLARTWEGRGAPPADPEATAIQAAERFVGGRISAAASKQRKLMLERLRNPALYVEEGSERERLESIFTCLLSGFLSGEPVPGFEDIFYQGFVANGGEEILGRLLPPGVTVRHFHAIWKAFSNDAPASPLAIVQDDVAVQIISLPYLDKTLEAMATADFERARSDGPLLVELCVFLASAIAALLPRDVLDRLWSLEKINWRLAVAVGGLPLLFELRRRNPEMLDANLAIARQFLPTWRETLEAARQRGAFADQEKQKAIIADTISRTEELLREGD